MASTLEGCVKLLKQACVRHHFDAEQQLIRVVFVTDRYHNLRGERLLIAQVSTPDYGRRCRVTVERAFAVGADAAATCLALCRAAADTPLVGVEFDADLENLRMVVEMAVEDGEPTRRQLVTMVESVVQAAEIWQGAIDPVASGSDTPAHQPASLGGKTAA